MGKERPEEDFNWSIAWAAQTACILEADAPKVGNVNRYHDFFDCGLEDFHFSALALGRIFGRVGRQGVGETVFQAVSATRQYVDTNTNLGIVLLLAPLGLAWSRIRSGAPSRNPGEASFWISLWREELGRVLGELTIEDTRQVYRAIRRAAPSGMGEVAEYDVFQEEAPQVTLGEAMRLAAHRDLIAGQYQNNFRQVLDVGYPLLSRLLEEGMPLLLAIAQTHLYLLSQYPDSLIARKMGPKWSKEVQKRAGIVWEQGGWSTGAGEKQAERLDRWLRKKSHALNPGATADLSAAVIFVLLLAHDFPRGRS